MIRAVALGAAVVLGVGVPVALVTNLALDDGSWVVVVLAPLVLAACVVGGRLAAQQLRAAPGPSLAAGAAAALAGYAVVVAVAQAVRVAQDEDTGEVAGIVASAAFAAACGLVGAALRRGSAR